jgi:hypothetical protein
VDTVVCYNNIPYPKELESLGVELYAQKSEELGYPLTPPDENPTGAGMAGSGWKLCPPRLRIEAQELWLDNDVVIRERVDEIDHWLEGGEGIISEGLHGVYGIYKRFIPRSTKMCAGVFGLPAGFDFGKEILRYCELLNGETLGHYDEQGLVAATVANMNHCVISMTNLTICESSVPRPLPSAMHFVGVNRNENHKGWNEYRTITI